MEGRIAAVGERDLILPLKAVGVEIFPAVSPQEATERMNSLVSQGYTIILVTENLAGLMQDAMRSHQNQPVPSIVPIPSTIGSQGFGMASLREAIRRAVGTDILADRR